jgi:methionyl-tRNA formyltransferase
VAPGAHQVGSVLAHAPDGPVVACADGALVLTRLQRAGRKVVTGAEFMRGAPDCAVGAQL